MKRILSIGLLMLGALSATALPASALQHPTKDLQKLGN